MEEGITYKTQKYNMKKSTILSSLLGSCFILLSIAAKAAVPFVTTNPVPDTVCTGNVAQVYVGVSDTTAGASAIFYKWQVSTDGGTTWSDILDVAPYSTS